VWADAKAAYRLVDRGEINEKDILGTHHEVTVERICQHKCAAVLLLQDTMDAATGEAFGLAGSKLWVRDAKALAKRTAGARNREKIREKGSWLTGQFGRTPWS
jgi:hypothetical protein